MANIMPSSKAAAAGAGVINTPFKSGAGAMPRKLLITGEPLASCKGKARLHKPFLVLSPEDAAEKTGAGGMLHRLALAAFRGARNSVPVWIACAETPAEAKHAQGSIAVTAAEGHGEGSLSLYIGGKAYQIPVFEGDGGEGISARAAVLINSDYSCPVQADASEGKTAFTSKSAGPWGNGVSIALNQRPAEGEALPEGVSCAVTPMAGGSGTPDFAAFLETALGRGDAANEEHFTEIIHGYGADSSVLDALSKYNGEGNGFDGLYSRTIARPFRSMCGNADAGADALNALLEFSGRRKNDRTSGIAARPGSLTHHAEIAAEFLGFMSYTAAQRAEGSYIGGLLSGIDPGAEASDAGLDWTREYANRDIAVRSGVSPLISECGAVKAQNAVSFFRPDNIPENSNMHRRMRDISITQNVLYALKRNFSSEKWQGFTVVKDKSLVTNSAARFKARDIDDVKDDDLALINSFAGLGWLYDPEYSINALRMPGAVETRPDGGGFNNSLCLVYSGEGGILDTIVYADASIEAAN